MNEDIEESTLTIGRLAFWCIVGVVMWAGIIQAAMFVWEVIK